MNKTISIGLAGYPFIIEEQAYAKLSEYLQALRNSLDSNEVEEVMHDIEIRIVEIFRESLGKREIINNDDVEKVIAQIGKPEVIEEQEEAFYSENQNTKNQKISHKDNKILLRDPENKKIAGVCSGLAHYFGIQISGMRAIWLVLALLGIFSAGISTTIIILIYIILWAVIPEAKSASDFLKMKGKPLNFDSLKEESVLKFADNVGEKAGELYNQNKPYIQSAGSSLGKIFRYIFGTIFSIIGAGLLIGAMFFILLDDFNTDMPFYDSLALMDNPTFMYSAFTFGFLSIFIPALIFIFLAIKLFSPKTKFNHMGYVFGALVLVWIGLTIYLSVDVIKQEKKYSGNNEISENISINTTSDSLHIEMKNISIPEDFKSFRNGVYFYNDKTIYKKSSYFLHTDVNVTRKEGNFSPYLIVTKGAKGYNIPIRMGIDTEVKDNKILIPNYIYFPRTEKGRNYYTKYELVVPKNFKIFSSKGIYINDEKKDKEVELEGFSETEMIFDINGVKIKIEKKSPDSIIINGKKRHSSEEYDIVDSLDIYDDYEEAKKLQNKISNPKI